MISALNSTEIQFLVHSLEFDLQHSQTLYSSKRIKFEEFKARLERYAAHQPEFSHSEKPSLWAFSNKIDEELQDLERVMALYEQILGKLRGGLRNAA